MVRLADRARLARELDRLFARKTPDAQAQKAADALGRVIDESVARVERLRALPLKIDYDTALPIVAHREEIAKALQERQLIVVCGATGSGKTTQLPKICIEAGRGALGLIVSASLSPAARPNTTRSMRLFEPNRLAP